MDEEKVLAKAALEYESAKAQSEQIRILLQQKQIAYSEALRIYADKIKNENSNKDKSIQEK